MMNDEFEYKSGPVDGPIIHCLNIPEAKILGGGRDPQVSWIRAAPVIPQTYVDTAPLYLELAKAQRQSRFYMIASFVITIANVVTLLALLLAILNWS